ARPLGIDIAAVSRLPCQPTDTRDTREDGRCLLLDLGIGQTMYTPDSLTDPHLEPRDRPYAGFLFASVGATSLDAPRMRDPESRFVMTQLSNMVIVGVTGPLAQARETQSLAHWTWSSGAVRPLGWHNQLRNAPQAALVTELHARPAGWELCNIRNGQGKRIGCGSIDERRQFDVTPRAEAVIGTYLRRASLGTVVRAGSRFPDVVSLSRIPTTRIFGRAREEGRSVWKRIVPEPYWWYGFAALDGRYVQHNSFIEGGYRDGGTDGWRSRRLIDARRTLAEGAVGVSVGNSSMTLTVQHIHRTPEYDVRDAPRAKGMHRYVTLNLAMFTRPGAH
ncbi:MAG TPA: lipid A-modifier LpxR family protein, partial [Gemmatimonadaceae bacterium]|nr:lipid A-modifier LpxR family protein [Gemmatimonadaceae bacterium]